MELWVYEQQTEHTRWGARVKETLHKEKTQYQDLLVVDTYDYGRMLLLDGVVQLTECDEFVYHEMMAHVALFTHPNPKKVLVIGGGDGGMIREVVKHPSVEKAVLAEIDDRVIAASKAYFPTVGSALDNPKVDIQVGDGIKYVNDHKGEFDVILIDSSDPIGPGEGLFLRDFYQSVHECLTEDGLFVAQMESPWYHRDLIARVHKDVKSVFPITKLYYGIIPTYPGGSMCFAFGSKQHDPLQKALRPVTFATRYYNHDVHRAAFALPGFIEELKK